MLKILKEYKVPLTIGGLACLWGGIYDFAAMLYGIMFSVVLFIQVSKKRALFIPTGIVSAGLMVTLCSSVIAALSANDKGIAVIGSVRILVLILFWLVWNNVCTEAKDKIWNSIPDVAIELTLIAIVLYLTPCGKEYFFRVGRLGGVFQYSNTYAVFLLISFIVLCFRKEQIRIKFVKAGILIGGILLCGSRSVFALLIFTIVFLLLRKKIEKKAIFLSILFAVTFCLVSVLFIDLDMERLLEFTLNSSTLNGRFLYWRDASEMIIKHPFGLGYMGYYFWQPQFQTGNYVTKFVHNDILQTALDAGVAAAVSLCVMITANICDCKNEEKKRIILVVLFLHCLFDFDLQFIFMYCLMLMCMDDKRGITCRQRAGFWKRICCILGAVYIYLAAAFGFFYFEKYRIALVLYPANTFALEALMLGGEAEEAADVIIEKNGMLADAYETAVRKHIERSEYLEGQTDIQGMITCAGYDIYYYNQAVYYLSMMLEQAVRNNDSSAAEQIIGQIQDIPVTLEKLKRRTSKLAYRIYDKPVFELEDEIEDYIRRLSEISLNIDKKQEGKKNEEKNQ